jgi:hypothetical protein
MCNYNGAAFLLYFALSEDSAQDEGGILTALPSNLV